MATIDLAYLALIAVALVADHLVIWPRFVKRAVLDPPRARLRLWWSWMGMLWALTILGMGLWIHEGRSLELLGLTAPVSWRLWCSAMLVLAALALYLPTIAKVAKASGSRKASLRTRFGSAAAMLPSTPAELAWFVALSLTAGACEEFVFRGYLMWFVHPFLGLWGAAAASCSAFALAHAYQGAAGIIKTGLLGALMAVIVIATGSLLPAIALHALIDVAAGVVAWLVFREDRQEPGVVSAACPPQRAQAADEPEGSF